VVVVPRIHDLTSALPAIGMTFGRAVIAPAYGANPEFLAGTENPLYEAGNAASLAAALERVAAMDHAGLGQTNARIAAQWTWQRLVGACLDGLGCHGRTRLVAGERY
jgi:glycosyltransferase involved in cell wall biosynthesis